MSIIKQHILDQQIVRKMLSKDKETRQCDMLLGTYQHLAD